MRGNNRGNNRMVRGIMKYLLIAILSFNAFAVERLIVTQMDGGEYHSEFETKELALANLRGRVRTKKWMQCDWGLVSNELDLTRISNDGSEATEYCTPKTFTYSIANIDDEISAEVESKNAEDARRNAIRLLKNVDGPLTAVQIKKILMYLIRNE